MNKNIYRKLDDSGIYHFYTGKGRGQLYITDDVYPDGSKRHYANGVLHCTSEPAIEYSNGVKRYFINGKGLSRQPMFSDDFEDALGFWILWDMLTDEERCDAKLLSHLPGVR